MWDSGVQILIFLAGLQTIPRSLYEAATIDGATSWELFLENYIPNAYANDSSQYIVQYSKFLYEA